jgi:prepilin-type N-terminal cleavage/methylation domain-containing protein
MILMRVFDESNTRRPGTQRGFTAIEILVVLAIVAILIKISVPAFTTWLPTLRLSGAAQQLATDLKLARTRAVALSASTTVSFTVSTASYTFGSDARNLAQLYPGITIVSATNTTFTAKGTANAVTITLSNGTSQKLVCVKTMGRVTVRDASCT